jgi:hypothetical protein
MGMQNAKHRGPRGGLNSVACHHLVPEKNRHSKLHNRCLLRRNQREPEKLELDVRKDTPTDNFETAGSPEKNERSWNFLGNKQGNTDPTITEQLSHQSS